MDLPIIMETHAPFQSYLICEYLLLVQSVFNIL